MIKPEIPTNEKERLKALYDLNILDTLPEKEFNDITKLASEICQTPISLITLVDKDRQWFKSKLGLKNNESSRDISFCAHAINYPRQAFIVPNARNDIRFIGNPDVNSGIDIVYYAGIPLTNSNGYTLGTLCVIDHTTRELTKTQLESLEILANQVVQLFELKKINLKLQANREELEFKNSELKQLAYVVSHDIKSPLNHLIGLTTILKEDYGNKLDEEGKDIIGFIFQSAHNLIQFVNKILGYYSGDENISTKKQNIELIAFLQQLLELIPRDPKFKIHLPRGPIPLIVNESALQQILYNLIINAVKYNDKEFGEIAIVFSENPLYYTFSVKDNGSGIAESDKEKIFDLFVNLNKTDCNNEKGTGIGLSTVKKLVQKLGGKILVNSELGKGTEFIFQIKK